jgi:hypothetical protein
MKKLLLAFWLLVLLAPVIADACQPYRDVIHDEKGNVIVGASVAVQISASGTAALIYTDRLCTTAATNPLTTSSKGVFEFYADDGVYDLVPSKPGYDLNPVSGVSIFDPLGENVVTVADFRGADICANTIGAIDAIGSTQKTLVINKPVTCSVTKTAPSTLTIQFQGRGLITVTSGAVLTVDRPENIMASPSAKIVSCSGAESCLRFSGVGIVYPHWWGALGNGSANDLLAVQAAYAASPVVHFMPGVYNFGTISGSSPLALVIINGHGDHAALLTSGRVKFIVQTQVNEIHYIFGVYNSNSVQIGDVEFEDSGFDINVTWRGAAGISLYAADDSDGPLHNVKISSVRGTNMVQAIFAGGFPSATNRIRNVHIGLLECTNCYYGWNAQNNGDDVVIDLIRTDNVYRSFFVYGVTGVKATIHSYNALASSGDIDISAYGSGYDTSAIDLKFVSRAAASSSYPIALTTLENSRASTVSGVTIDADIDATDVDTLAKWVDYTGTGGAENTGATNNKITGIVLKGRLNSSAVSPVRFAASAQPATTGMPLALEGDFLVGGAHSSIRPYFDLAEDFGNYTPVWTAATANPDLGNGTLLGKFHRRGRLVTVWVHLTAGNTTTFGTGIWAFSLPIIKPTDLEGGIPNAIGVARFEDAGTALYYGTVNLASVGGANVLQAEDTTGLATAAVPFAWTTDDKLTMQVSYYLDWP